MQKGKIGVTSENIFPIIKKFLYSEQEIFLRELISNAVDATQKMKAIASKGELKGDLGDITIRVKIDQDNKTLTISDAGIGMTADEVDRYINQIAFSSAGEFLDKYKDKIEHIIGHFGLGFYSAFMVSKKVEIITLSYQEGAKAVRWSCDGSPEYSLEETEKSSRGTDIILYLDDESQDYLQDSKIEDLLKKYCKFLPVEIGFGKVKEWKDDKYEETDKDKIVNNTKPAWTKKPTDLTDDDYKAFYKELYPGTWEEPLFNIHLNVDYPFNLTGILYFPKLRTNLEIQKNKIQLYCRQVYVTDTVEGIVPEYLTLLHGILDSPDIPLNVSRSYLQGDPNVKKISSHITKKVTDKLSEIFKNQREDFEKKWDDLKLFIQYGMLTDEKFYERAKEFFLVKNIDGKYFSLEEYKKIIEGNQTDKNNTLVYLYASNKIDQYSAIEAAKAKGYDILLLDGHLDSHFVNFIENKLGNTKFTRVDSDVVEKLIRKDEAIESKITKEQQDDLKPVFDGQVPDPIGNFTIEFEPLQESDLPVVVTQSEYMRRMKEMGKLGGPGSSFYDNLPSNYNLVVNTNHPLISQIMNQKDEAVGKQVEIVENEIKPFKSDLEALEQLLKGKKDEEISQEEREKREELENKIHDLRNQKENILKDYGKTNKLVKQVVDLALLSNNLLKGEDLTKFVKRSVELIEV